tara:strand:- start:180 stop:1526 length:1347 start_codon:yes stop_codon:yes gene_type:complete
MKRNNLLLLLILVCLGASAQDLEFTTPVALPSFINESSEEMAPLVSPDGHYLYFARAYSENNKGGEYAGDDIWVSEITNDTVYALPKNNFPHLNNKDNNVVVGFSEHTDTLYLLNIYGEHHEMLPGVSCATHIDGKHNWNDPIVWDDKIKFEGDNYMVYIHTTGDIMFLSMDGKDALGKEDLYVSTLDKNGGWSEPLHLGENVNSTGFEISPFLSESKDTLYFSSDGHGGLGDADIYYSVREDSSWVNWSDPVNIGAPINSQFYDAFLSIAPNGVHYFVSNRGKHDLSDIYRSRRIYPVIDSSLFVSDSSLLLTLEETIVTTKTIIAVPVKKIPDVRAIYYKYNGRNVKWVSAHEHVILSQVTEILKKDIDLNVKLVGFASDEGSEAYNQILSEDRAESVKEYLVQHGVDSHRLQSKGFGEHFPTGDNKTPGGRSKNRRVEIHFFYNE